MFRGNIAIWCYALLLVTLFSISYQNFTSNKEKDDNLTISYKLNANSTANYSNQVETLLYDLNENSVKSIQYNNTQQEYRFEYNNDKDDNSHSVQYEHGTRFTQNRENDNQIFTESRMNSTKIVTEKNFTSQEIHENVMTFEGKNDSLLCEFFQNSNKNKIDLYDKNTICIQLCCPFGDRLVNNECKPGGNEYPLLPNVYGYTNDLLQSENKRVDELFPLVVYDPCKMGRAYLYEDYNDYMIYANGSLYLYHYKMFIKSTYYCLAVKNEDSMFLITMCSKTLDEINYQVTNSTYAVELNKISFINMGFHIMPILFLLPILLIYSILPELQKNFHGLMLRNYITALLLKYVVDMVNILSKAMNSICVTIAFFIFFFSMASCFWLSVISFDMWRTFRSALQRNVKQRERKKLISYVVFAWGIPFIFAIICIILDFVPGMSKTFRPRFRTDGCWFGGNDIIAFILYYYGFVSVCIISSICLSIFTALKIAQSKKDINQRLTDSESKRYNDNKKWFNLYLKLFITQFIVMGIKWILMSVSGLTRNVSSYNSYVVNSLDAIQNFCIFVIFVWKKKIKQILWKRFGCGPFSKARCAKNTTAANISTSRSEEMAMQNEMSSCGQAKTRAKSSSDMTDF